MPVLYWGKPEKIRSSKAHAEMYSSDTGIPGTYVPNMSDADKQRWKAKHIKGKDERIEIRKTVNGTQMLIVVHKTASNPDKPRTADWHDHITISANGKLKLSIGDFENLNAAVREAIKAMNCALYIED